MLKRCCWCCVVGEKILQAGIFLCTSPQLIARMRVLYYPASTEEKLILYHTIDKKIVYNIIFAKLRTCNFVIASFLHIPPIHAIYFLFRDIVVHGMHRGLTRVPGVLSSSR